MIRGPLGAVAPPAREVRHVEHVGNFQQIKEAIGSGEFLAIRYHGGSQPGAHREVEPLAMIGTDKVRMRCRTSGGTKTFNVDKIELLEAKPAAGEAGGWTAAAPRPVAPATLTEIEAEHRAELEAIGWHVERSGEPGEETLGLYKRTKGCKLLKHPTVTLSFETTAWDLIAMPDGTIQRGNFRPRVRPWSVRGRAGGLGTWGGADKALAAFLREASTYP